jgi:hypothetical protein
MWTCVERSYYHIQEITLVCCLCRCSVWSDNNMEYVHRLCNISLYSNKNNDGVYCIKRCPFTVYAENESCLVRVIPLHVPDNIISVPPCSSRVECGHFRESLPCYLFIDSCCFTIAKQEINSKKVKPFAWKIRLTPFTPRQNTCLFFFC